jgi:hypothetical protein
VTVDVDYFRQMLAEERERVVNAIGYLHEENPGTKEDENGESSARTAGSRSP